MMMVLDKRPNPDDRRLKVFFDGSCPRCRREIKLYRRLTGSINCHWIDANTMNAGEMPKRFTREGLLNRFHVEHPTEGLLSGALAFGMLWRELFGWRWIYTIVKIPIVTLVCELTYRGFLLLRKILKWKPVQ